MGVYGSSLGQDLIEFFLAFSDQYNAIFSAYLGELSKLQSFLVSIFGQFYRFITTLDELLNNCLTRYASSKGKENRTPWLSVDI